MITRPLLDLNRFRQSQGTANFKDHYKTVGEWAKKARVLKLGRGYFDWEFFVRPKAVERQLARDVAQLQGYLSPLGEPGSRGILLSYERNFGNYSIENVAFSAGALSTIARIAELIRTNNSRELIIATPNYPQLEEDAVRHGPVRLVAAKKENGYCLTADEIGRHLTKKTSGVVLINPNIAGRYLEPRELGKIIDLLQRNNVFLILDETNDTVQWLAGGMKLSAAGLPIVRRAYPENIDSPCVIRQRSFSKGDMLAEYRIGYVVAMPEVIDALEQSVGANTPPSSATEAVKFIISASARWALGQGALQGQEEREYIEELRVNSAYIDAVRLYASSEIRKIACADIIPPQNGFNIFFRIKPYGGWKLFEKLLYGCNFSVNPGSCFGFRDSDGWVRLTLANAPDKVDAAMERMHESFPSRGKHRRFEFAEITKMRVWDGCRLELEKFLP